MPDRAACADRDTRASSRSTPGGARLRAARISRDFGAMPDLRPARTLPCRAAVRRPGHVARRHFDERTERHDCVAGVMRAARVAGQRCASRASRWHLGRARCGARPARRGTPCAPPARRRCGPTSADFRRHGGALRRRGLDAAAAPGLSPRRRCSPPSSSAARSAGSAPAIGATSSRWRSRLGLVAALARLGVRAQRRRAGEPPSRRERDAAPLAPTRWPARCSCSSVGAAARS